MKKYKYIVKHTGLPLQIVEYFSNPYEIHGYTDGDELARMINRDHSWRLEKLGPRFRKVNGIYSPFKDGDLIAVHHNVEVK